MAQTRTRIKFSNQPWRVWMLTKNSLDPVQINRAVDLLTQAKRISFFGLGASSAVARDAQNKFIRFNIPISCFEDIVMQRMSCINCTDNDVIVLISHTGRTKSQVEIANLARENGATVIAITAKDSPLDKASSLSICLDVPEDTDVYMPMASRVVQMTVIDVLATGFTLRRGSGFRENLKAGQRSFKRTLATISYLLISHKSSSEANGAIRLRFSILAAIPLMLAT